MKQALLLVSGISIGLLASLVSLLSGGTELLPRAEAQAAAPGTAQAGGNLIMGIGGSGTNQNDLCWVLQKERVKNRAGQEVDRVSLTLYRVASNGSAFDLIDARDISYDGKLAQLNVPGHNKELAPATLKKKHDEELRREEEERAREERERARRGN